MEPVIAVIDSGVNPRHPHVGSILGGHGLEEDGRGRVERTAGFTDEIGHGTAICGILRHKSPFAKIYAVKIFKTRLCASISVLTTALAWCIDQGVHIIHLSLGVENRAYAGELADLCRQACRENILVLASAEGPDSRIYPACLDSVIGVWGRPDCPWDQVQFHPGARVQFSAHPHPRPIPGLPRENNFKGHSFAVAHVTARVARLRRENPGKSPDWIREALAQKVETVSPPVEPVGSGGT